MGLTDPEGIRGSGEHRQELIDAGTGGGPAGSALFFARTLEGRAALVTAPVLGLQWFPVNRGPTAGAHRPLKLGSR